MKPTKPNLRNPVELEKYLRWKGTVKQHRKKQLTRVLIERYGMVCGICGQPIKSRDDVSIDHIIPLSKGGADIIQNMQLAHKHCNCVKSDNLPSDF